MKQAKSIKRFVILASMSLLIAACGGGGGGGGGGNTLNGTWRGNLEDTSGGMHRITVTVSGGNSIDSILIDGVDQEVAGVLTAETANIWGFTLTDDTEGGFIVDSARKHLTFVDEDFSVGVLQKAAGALPSFSQGDIAGSASGLVVTSDLETFQQYSGSITCDAAGNCSGSDGVVGDFSAAVLLDSTLGRWSGSSSFAGGSAEVAVFMSADKKFAGSWSCSGAFSDNCSFSAWSR
jgi:hypothetical protein